MSVVWFSVFAALSIACTRLFCRRGDPRTNLLYGVYAVSYLITVVIGAVVLGLSTGDVWDALNFGVDVSPLAQPGFTYWCLLFSPFVIVPSVISIAPKTTENRNQAANNSTTPMSIPGFALVFTIFSSFCFVQLYFAGALPNMFDAIRVQDYQDLILARADLLSVAKTPFYGVIYMSLPALCCLAMFQMFRTKQNRWRIAFIASVLVTAVLSLSIRMKGPALLLFMLLVLGRHVLKGFHLFRMALATLAAFVGFTVWQGLFYSGWTAVGSVYMVFFRMAHGFPFYVSLFPHRISYLGSNYGLALLGIGGGNNDNLLVFDQMYPAITWVQGAVASPAHVRAFAQAGLGYALFSLCVVGLIIAGLAWLRNWKTSPYQFAIFSQAILVAYYLSQTSIRGILVESFSIMFGLVAIGAVWSLNALTNLAARNVSAEVDRRCA